ncbi:MAG: ABC transporter permease [Vulcanimicrobiaceae bacterium]
MRFLPSFGRNKLAYAGLVVFASIALLALLAPFVAPYDPHEMSYTASHQLESLLKPSARHWLGTTLQGRDVLSQLIFGTRIALLVGIVDAILIGVIGTGVGIVSGYYSGKVDQILMRLVDILYSIPFEPFAIAVLAILGTGLWRLILIIAILLWRDPARVIRAQTLSLVQRPYVKSARAAGAGDLRIMLVHIAPSVLPLSLSYMALSAGWSIIAQTSISFLGFGDPNAISWGTMLNDVFANGQTGNAWWWSAPPGLMIVVLVLSIFLMSRAYEEMANPRLRKW